jgi:hypothetical protein
VVPGVPMMQVVTLAYWAFALIGLP